MSVQSARDRFIWLAVLGTISVFIIQYLFPGEFSMNFAADFFATLFGVIIGIAGGQWIDSHNRKDQDNKERELIVESLLAELDTNLQFHNKNRIVKEQNPKEAETYVRLLTLSGYESIIFSGKYSRLLKPKTQRYLSFHYEGVRQWNITAKLFEEIWMDTGPHPDRLLEKLQRIHTGLEESFSPVKEILDSELSMARVT